MSLLWASRQSRLPGFVAVILLAANAAAADLPEHVLQLARLKAKMKQSLNTLPDYTCLCVTDRFRQERHEKALRPIDRVSLEVAYAGKRELFAWPGDSEFRFEAPAEMIGSGMFGSGEFIAHLRAVFLGGTAVIRFVGEETMPGRKTLHWDFSISPFLNDWSVGFASAKANAGAKGSFWVDAATLELQSFEVRTDGLPPGFPIDEVRTVIVYALTRIGTREILLPQSATTTMNEVSGQINVNQTEFSHCRQFQSHSVIRFDASNSESVSAAGGTPGRREITLPSNLKLAVTMTTPLDSSSAMVGQRIEAVVKDDASDRKSVIVPRGALLSGRLRRVELHSNPPPPFYTIALEFTDVTFDGQHARFFGKLADVSGPPGLRPTVATIRARDSGKSSNQRVTYRVGELPGVGTFILEGDFFRLEKGLEMTWITQDVRK